MPHAQIGDFLAAIVARLNCFDIRAHFLERLEQPGAQRVRHHAFQHEVRARHDQRRHQRKCRRRRIGRHDNRRGLEFRLAMQHDAAAMIAV